MSKKLSKVDQIVANILEGSADEPIIPDRLIDVRTTSFFSEVAHTTLNAISNASRADGDIGRKLAKVCIPYPRQQGVFGRLSDWTSYAFGDEEEAPSILAYCPRVHSMIPDPFVVAEQKNIWPSQTVSQRGSFSALVNSFLPTGPLGSARFVAATPELADMIKTVQPGQWVWVEYGDKVNKTNGLFVGVYDKVAMNREGTNPLFPPDFPTAGSKDTFSRSRPLPPAPVREDPNWRDRKNESPQLSNPAQEELDSRPPPDPAQVNYLIRGRQTATPSPFHQPRGNKKHQGVDLYAREGTQTYSVVDGNVQVAGSIQGYGLTVVVYNRATNKQFLYGHLSSIKVTKGQPIKKGKLIGHIGRTAHYRESDNSSYGQFFTNSREKAHLHFEVLTVTGNRTGISRRAREDDREDPMDWLRDNGLNSHGN